MALGWRRSAACGPNKLVRCDRSCHRAVVYDSYEIRADSLLWSFSFNSPSLTYASHMQGPLDTVPQACMHPGVASREYTRGNTSTNHVSVTRMLHPTSPISANSLPEGLSLHVLYLTLTLPMLPLWGPGIFCRCEQDQEHHRSEGSLRLTPYVPRCIGLLQLSITGHRTTCTPNNGHAQGRPRSSQHTNLHGFWKIIKLPSPTKPMNHD